MSTENTTEARDRDIDTARDRLYEVMDDESSSTTERIESLLAVSREYLGVENGHVERFDETEAVNHVVASVGLGSVLPVGAELDRATTFCRRTIDRESPLALSNASEEGWADDPAFERFGFECYLGTRVTVDGDRWGTVCFLSNDARPSEFSSVEKLFVELVGRLVGRALERDRLAEQREDLDRAERKYATLVDAAPDAIVVINAETKNIVEANEAAADLCGDGESLVGRSLFDMHPPDRRETYREAFEAFLADGGTTDQLPDGSPILVRCADGTDVPVEIAARQVDLDGTPHVVGVLRDVSTRNERLSDLRAKTRAVDEAPLGITVADAEGDQPLTYVNERFEEMTGYDTEDAVGLNCRFLQGPETDPGRVATLREAIDECRRVTVELRNYRANGSQFWNELTVAPVTDDTGETTQFVGIQRDVTDRRRRDQLVRVMNRVLRHNLRNDMNVVVGLADLLADRVDDERTASKLAQISDTGNELIALSEKAQTIEAVVTEARPTRPVDVRQLVERAAEQVRADHPDASVSVTGANEATAEATSWLLEAVAELGHNAVEHGGSTVEFDIDVQSDDGVVVGVSDDGPGIREQDRAELEGERDTPLEHGSSLGCWMVNWIVTGFGGEVAVEVADGTTVRLLLPTADR